MPESTSYPGQDILVDPDWLKQHLNDPDVRVVDCDSEQSYKRAHIPGAIWNPDNFIKDDTSLLPEDPGYSDGMGHRVHVKTPEQISSFLEALGIGTDTTVVAYSDSPSTGPGRLWWVLNYYGHTKVKALNGGWRRWLKEGGPVSIEPAKERPGVRFTPKLDPSLYISTEELNELYDNPGVVVWDTRSLGEYTGENKRHNRRSGHAPGAKWLEWVDTIDPETHMLKPASVIKEMLQSKGITPEKEVLTH